MLRKRIFRAAGISAAALLSAARASFSQAPPAPTPAAKEEVVVSATKVPEDPVDVAASVSVVTGEQLRRQGARTLAEALQNVAGLDTGEGSDNGARLPNIGLWGLKEFDALLVTVDGVPIGGPFNPSLSQIPVEDIDHIEIVRGPQGTLYGVAAFAGMIQIFTRHGKGPGGSASAGGGSFSERRASASYHAGLARGLWLRAWGSTARGDGWQDRTDFATDRLALSGGKKWAEARLDLSMRLYRDTSLFGSPLPLAQGKAVEGFRPERNDAIGGARLDHHVFALSSNLSVPLSSGVKIENTLGFSRDSQISVRSFVVALQGETASATGVALKPVETTFFDDARLVWDFSGAGRHRLVTGAAVTWGRTTASGTGFDFRLTVLPKPVVPDLSGVPAGDQRSFRDRRTFVGFYANDEWTPAPPVTITAGLRYDMTSESLSASRQEAGAARPDQAEDRRHDGRLSGGLSALYRFLDRPAGPLSVANAYVSARSSFKPAAPNLTGAGPARILEPEDARSGEIGVKTRWFDRTLSFDVTFFRMDFKNLVVSVLGPGREPALINAGEERFQGADLEAHYYPPALDGLSLSAGYGHHDARFVHFSFVNEEGMLVAVDGNRLELAPRELWNLGATYAPARGPGAFLAFRHQGRRPLNRRNTFHTEGFTETDIGVSWDFPWGRLAVVGRNLGDSRHFTTESEIGDSQFYVAPPRRYSAQLTVRF